MPPRADTPRDLLLALLALQTGLIDQSGLILAFHAWSRAASRSMAEILAEQGAIDGDQRSLLVALAAQHLKKHGDDPQRSLAALGAGPSTRAKLAAIADTDLDASLAVLGTRRPDDDDPYRTASQAAGSTTSGGRRFRVLRPHARGGLGEVFVALDAELNREVALKEILDRHADDPDCRSRFLVEAEITGGLEHPGIVPVYGLGHHDDGRPFYAMRFIRGDNLKEAIARHHEGGPGADPGARSLELRKLLRRFIDVCNAIEYAHSRGVLHRDIKPGNIIVGRHGETLVVDWGLAKPLGRPGPDSATDERSLAPASTGGSSETLPGQAVGTPAYMSPEQAAGDLDRLGPRSDVYSLGATLYCLLTGGPPFEGGDLGAVLRRVREGSFPRPRSAAPSLDPALEAVCLKAMAKAPEGRYATPRHLAEDVERWSADEPVVAYREPIARRARRWARRHRTAVTAASAAALAALIGLAGVLAVQSRANRDLKSKNEELTDAHRRVVRANADLRAAGEKLRAGNVLLVEANDRESRTNAELAATRDRVQARFDLAIESIHALQTTVIEDQVLKDERFHPLRDKLLRAAAEFHGRLGALLEGQADRRSLLTLATSYHDLGALTAGIGVRPEALAIFRKELATRRELARGGDPGDILGLARALLFVGNLADQTGDSPGGLAAYEEARGLVEGLAWPASLATGASSALASSHNNIGALLGRTGQAEKALESHGRALEIQERLARGEPANAEFQADLATTHGNIGALLGRTGRTDGALESHGRALEIRRNLARDNPAVTEFRADLAITHNNIGTLLGQIGRPAEALESHGRALEIRRELARANPAVTEFRADLASSHHNIGSQLARAGEPAKALEALGRALEIRRELARSNPAVTEFRADLASSHGSIGFLQDKIGEPAGALESYHRALEIRRALGRDDPADAAPQAALATIHNNIGALLGRTGERSGALEEYGRALEIRRVLARANPTVTEYQADLASTISNIGSLLVDGGEPARALEPYGRALEIRRKLAEANPAVTEYQADLARSHNNLGSLLGRTGQTAGALEAYGRALEIRRVLARDHPATPEYQSGLFHSLAGVGLTSADLGRAAEAVARLREAVATGGRLAREPATLFDLACYQSRLAEAARLPGSGLSAEEARAEGDRAVAMLRRAAKAGYRDLGRMRGSRNLEPLRRRPDFQSLLMDLAFPDRAFAP